MCLQHWEQNTKCKGIGAGGSCINECDHPSRGTIAMNATKNYFALTQIVTMNEEY
jgi:hypothetical protein